MKIYFLILYQFVNNPTNIDRVGRQAGMQTDIEKTEQQISLEDPYIHAMYWQDL